MLYDSPSPSFAFAFNPLPLNVGCQEADEGTARRTTRRSGRLQTVIPQQPAQHTRQPRSNTIADANDEEKDADEVGVNAQSDFADSVELSMLEGSPFPPCALSHSSPHTPPRSHAHTPARPPAPTHFHAFHSAPNHTQPQ